MSEAWASTARDDQLVHEPDDRRFARHVLEAANVVLAGGLGGAAGRAVAGLIALAAVAVQAIDGAVDLAFRRDAAFEPAIEQERERRARLCIERIGDREADHARLDSDRQDPVRFEKLQLQLFRQYRLIGKVAPRVQSITAEFGQRLGQVDNP